MTNAGSPENQAEGTETDPVVTLRQEQVRVGTEWLVAGRVRVARRVVTETRTVEITVRREELVVETDAALNGDGNLVGAVLDGPAVAAPAGPVAPLVIVLREERPEVVTRAYPYERVTVHVDLAQTEQQIVSQVRREAADFAVETPR